MVATNLSGGTLPADGRIELAFDRLLLPLSTIRQTFILQHSRNALPAPHVAYDPVARVVTVTPLAALDVGQSYTLTIASPSSPNDLNGLRAIDGAHLSPASPHVFGFTAVNPAGLTAVPQPDFCADLQAMLDVKCGQCHSGNAPAAGLFLSLYSNPPISRSASYIRSTAIGRVAQGSNTGALAGTFEQATLLFAEDMPIIDPGLAGGTLPSTPDAGVMDGAVADAGGLADATVAPAPSRSGDPGHSWLMYKLLMAVPPSCDPAGAPQCDAGNSATPPYAQAKVSGYYSTACSDAGAPCPQPLSDSERQRLSNLMQGREMPLPGDFAAPLAANTAALTLDELEVVSFWIAAGAIAPDCPAATAITPTPDAGGDAASDAAADAPAE